MRTDPAAAHAPRPKGQADSNDAVHHDRLAAAKPLAQEERDMDEKGAGNWKRPGDHRDPCFAPSWALCTFLTVFPQSL
jgi:hypothetical protein